MGELNVQTISKRAIKGAFSLTLRRVALQAISFLTINIILARILPVSTLGIFNIGAAIIAFFSFFSDIGLAAAIIQKKEITREDLKTTFSIQQLLVIFITVVVFIFAPFFANFYELGEGGTWLIRALALAFLLTSFKVIPSVLLERDLRFNPLVTVEILETLVFNILLIILSKMGFGLAAFSVAAVARSFSGVILIYLIAPWKIGIGIFKGSAKSLLAFGVPFQLNAILALLKDRLVPLVVARIIGTAGMGYVTWAQNLAFLPLEVMNIIIRVTFPTLSRLQDEKLGLKIALEKSLFATCVFLYPILFGMLALAPSVVQHVVSPKWQPALPAFYLFSLATFWATLSTTFTNTLNAIGQIKITLKLMIFWTILTWILTPIFTFYFGFIGVAISSAIISMTSILTIILVKRFVAVAIWNNIWQPLVSSALMSVLVFYLSKVLVSNIWTLLLVIFLGGIIYTSLLFAVARKKIMESFRGVKDAFKKT